MRRKCFISLLALALCTTACTANSNKTLLETYNQNQTDTVIDNASDLKNFEKSGSDSNYDITSDVSGYATGAIYTVSPKEFTPSYLTELADKIFDKNSWSVCTPFEVASLNELKKELEIIDNTAETIEEIKAESSNAIIGIPQVYYNRIEEAIANNPDTAEKELKKENCIVTYEKGDETISAALFKGKIGKDDYALIYEESDSDQYLNPMITTPPAPSLSLLKISPTYAYWDTVTELPEDSSYNITASAAEEIPVDKKTALNQAEEFLAQVGFDNFTLMNTGKRNCLLDNGDSADEATISNGYSFSFTRKLNATHCPLTEGMIYCNTFTNSTKSNLNHDELHHDSEPKDFVFVNDGTYTPVEFIRVDVGVDGITNVEFYNLFDLGEAITEKPNLLTYEQAYEIFENAAIYPYNKSNKPTKVLAYFSYIPLSYKDGFAYMPVWVFMETPESYLEDYDYGTSSMDCGNMLVAINAVDGTEIYANNYPIYSLIFHDRAHWQFK